MPNIAELLEREDEDFVSLQELLTAMAEGYREGSRVTRHGQSQRSKTCL